MHLLQHVFKPFKPFQGCRYNHYFCIKTIFFRKVLRLDLIKIYTNIKKKIEGAYACRRP